MKKSFTSIALLLVAILVTVLQTAAAAPVENQDTDAAAADSTPQVSAQDLWNQYYGKMASSSPALV